jgi:non-ribosomal peptide synthetase component F
MLLLGSLYKCLVATQCSHVLTTPSLWASVTPPPPLDEGRHALQVVALGGEAMPEIVIESWSREQGVRLLNVYGVTECAVYNTVCEVRPGQDRRGIGEGLGSSRLYIIRGAEEGEQAVTGKELEVLWGDAEQDVQEARGGGEGEEGPGGVEGELVIAGLQVGERYLNRRELSREKFIRLPGCPDAGLCFRTGDWVRWERRAGGCSMLWLLGRRDSQVKVQGKRVDLEEIEGAILRSHVKGGKWSGDGLKLLSTRH